MIKKCLGCGIRLQTTNESLPGYIPKEKLKDGKLCARCFKINHYNAYDLTAVPKNNEEIIRHVNHSQSQCLFLIDFLNINSETIATYQKITIPKVLIISKSDIIPKSIKQTKIINWLKEVYQIQEDIYFLSTKKDQNTNLFTKLKSPFFFLLGYTNSGKSTYLNHLLNTKMNSNLEITTSMIPNTTLDFITINLTKDLKIIDSPGFTYQNTFYNPDEIEVIKHINPKNFISPLTYQIKPIMSIVIEDRLVLNFDTNTSITLYLSNSIEIKKIYNPANYQNLKTTQLSIPRDSDLVIKGVGFINIKNACNLTIYSELIDLLEVRPSLFRKE